MVKVDVQLYQEYNSHIIHMTILWIILLMICTYIIIRYIYDIHNTDYTIGISNNIPKYSQIYSIY